MDEGKLLRNIYANVDLKKLKKVDNSLDGQDIETLFVKISELLGVELHEPEVQETLELENVSPENSGAAGELHLYTDGAARGNPGPAAIGCALKDAKGNRILDNVN